MCNITQQPNTDYDTCGGQNFGWKSMVFFFLSPPWFSRINLQIPKQLFNLFFHQILSLFFWLVFVLLEIVLNFFFNFIPLQFFCISYLVPVFLLLFVLFVLIFIVNFFNDSLLYFLFLSNLILIFLIVFFLLNWSRIYLIDLAQV
jgi:hypothetical protein